MESNEIVKDQLINSVKVAFQDIHGIKILDYNNIIHCKAEGNYTIIFFNTGKTLVTKTLKQVESLLPNDIFLRIHKSHIVNINKIAGFKHKNKIILISDIELPIARRR